MAGFLSTFQNVFVHNQGIKQLEEVLKLNYFFKDSPGDVECSFDNTAEIFLTKTLQIRKISRKICCEQKQISSKRSSGHVDFSLKNNAEIIFTKRPEIFLSKSKYSFNKKIVSNYFFLKRCLGTPRMQIEYPAVKFLPKSEILTTLKIRKHL